MKNSSAGQWHVVRTRAGAEAEALIGLEKAGLAAYLPTELVRVTYRGTHRGRSEVQWRPLFAGTLFAMFDPGRDLRRVSEIRGVDGALRRNGRLTPISEDALRALKRAERDAVFDAVSGCRVPDDDAQPLDSRFASLMTRVKRERGSKRRTKLLMELLLSQ
jgi:hypothetical protein